MPLDIISLDLRTSREFWRSGSLHTQLTRLANRSGWSTPFTSNATRDSATSGSAPPLGVDYLSQVPPELHNIIFSHLEAPTTFSRDEQRAHARETASLALVSRLFLHRARIMLYSHLQLDIRENEYLAGRWHEMSKEDDTAIEQRYQEFACSYSKLGRVLIQSDHLAHLVTSIDIEVDNSAHNISPDPAARLLTCVLAKCSSIERIALRGSRNGQSPALLRAIVEADCHPRSISFDGSFCTQHDPDAVCPDCLDGVERFIQSRTNCLEELSLVDRETRFTHKTLERVLSRSDPVSFRLTRIELDPPLGRLSRMLQDLASPSVLEHLTLHINHLASRNERPSLPPLPSLASLTIIVPFLNERASLGPFIQLLSNLEVPSLTHLTLTGYVKLAEYATLSSIFRTTSAHGPALERLTSSLTSIDLTGFPLSTSHVNLVLDTCPLVRQLGIALPARLDESEVGGWNSAREAEVRTRCWRAGVELFTKERDAQEWIAAAREWRGRG